jgi:hypothetical protein
MLYVLLHSAPFTQLQTPDIPTSIGTTFYFCY